MREEEMKEKIKQSAKDLMVPESLIPETMMKTLQNSVHQDEDEGKVTRIKRRTPWYYGTAVAAAAVVLGIFAMKNQMPIPGDGGLVIATEPNMAAENIPVTLLEESEDALNYKAKDYDEVYDRFQLLLKEQTQEYGMAYGNRDGFAVPAAKEAKMEAADQTDMGTGTKTEAPSYSDTNTQVTGVDEGDVVKTDGSYIYVASANYGTIRIIEPNGKEMKAAGIVLDSSTVEGARTIREFYINKDKMTVIRSASEAIDQRPGDRQQQPYGEISEDIFYYDYFPYQQVKSVTYIETYDMTDRNNPKLSGSVCQDGYYSNSRRNGDYVSVFTNHYSDINAAREDISRYVPNVNGSTIPADCIYMPEQINSAGYLVISSVDMKNPEKPVSAKAIMADGDLFYVSQDHIYVGATKYDFRANQYNYTELLKLSYRDGRIGLVAHGTVNGYLNNQFSMDEFEGKLRLVNTLAHNNGMTTNSLYVLDEKLNVCGKIEDLAPGEQIYSARFMGEVAYFVTFRNMDPLFCVDLSNPTKPKILSELKITGFSEYLHPYANNMLLGIGREMDPDSGNFKGLKLSMFDTADLKNVQEKQKLVEASFENSAAWYNHKAVLIDAAKNLIGFPVEHYDYDRREWGVSYVVYSYDKAAGFKQKLNFELDTTGDYSSTRGLYIGDYLYVVENNQIHAFSLKDFSCLAELKY